jgi:hypothetical protein
MRVFGAVIFAAGIAIGVAPPAAADESDYLNQLQPKFANLTTEQLLTEGYKVCRFISAGRPSPDAIPMVVQDLQISVAAATDIVPAAIEELDC